MKFLAKNVHYYIYIRAADQSIQKNRIIGHRDHVCITALKEYALDTSHKPDCENVVILHKVKNYHSRFVLEKLYIKNDKHSVNDRTDLKYTSY